MPLTGRHSAHRSIISAQKKNWSSLFTQLVQRRMGFFSSLLLFVFVVVLTKLHQSQKETR